jgi:hypothetical protein
MTKGDLDIDEAGQLIKIEDSDKLSQDIAEALNSEYDSLKKFGGNLITMNNLRTKQEVVSEIYKILGRLMEKQNGASSYEKIKSIKEVTVLQKDSSTYAYISVSSYKDEIIDGTYSVL